MIFFTKTNLFAQKSYIKYTKILPKTDLFDNLIFSQYLIIQLRKLKPKMEE